MPVVFEPQRGGIAPGFVGRVPGADTPDPKRPDFLSETLPQAFGLENTVGALTVRESGLPDTTSYAGTDPAFDPLADIGGYEDHAEIFAFANNADEVSAVKRQVDAERGRRETLARAGWTGVAATMIAGLVDPINLIPVGGTAYKTYRLGGRIGMGALTTARAGLLGSSAAEALLHHTQQTRTWGESAANVATATFLSGVLGGALAPVRQMIEARGVGRAYDRVLRVPEGVADDPLVRIQPNDIESTIVARGGWKGLGDIEVKGAGWGLVKFIWKHGTESEKAPGRQVTRSDVTAFPKVIRDYEYRPGMGPGNRLWVVESNGRRVAYVDRRFAEDGQRRVVSIHVVDDADTASYPLSAKKSPAGSSRRDSRPTEDTAPEHSTRLRQGGQPVQESIAGTGPEVTKAAWDDVQARLDDDLTVPRSADPDPLTEPGSVPMTEDDLLADTGARLGEEAADNLDDTNGPAGGSTVGAAQARVGEEKLKSALGVEKAIKKTNPLLRTTLSESVETRRVTQQMVEGPFYYEKNALGIATETPVETIVKRWNANLAEASMAVQRAFVRYRTGTEGRGVARIALGDLVPGVERSGKLTWPQFRKEVGRAMRRGDDHMIPEVAESAREMRRLVFDPLKEEAIRTGQLPEDVDVETATSYLMRVWNVDKIIARRPEFVARTTQWLRGQRDTAAGRLNEVEAGIEELSAKAEPVDAAVIVAEGERTLAARALREARTRDTATARDLAAAEREIRTAEAELRRTTKRAETFKPTNELPGDDPLVETLRELKRGAAKRKPMDLTAWVVRNGGLRESGGELRHSGMTAKARPGLINNKGGMTLDDAALKAWEAGYFPPHSARPDIDEFATALGDDFNGRAKSYTEDGWDAVAHEDYLAETARWLDEQGIDIAKATPAEVRAAIEAAESGTPSAYRKATPAARARFREIEFQRRRAEARLKKAHERLIRRTERRDAAILELERARDDMANARKVLDDETKRRNRLRRNLDRLERRQAGEKLFATLEDQELQDIAEEISHRVTGTPGGRIGYEAMQVPLKRGAMLERSFTIPDELMEDFLESDIDVVARHYVHTMAPDVELASVFGRADMQDAIAKIRDDYTRKIERAGSEAERKRLDKAMRSDIKDIEAMRDRLRGTYAAPTDPNGMLVRVARGVRDWNYLRLLGGMTVSAFPDLGRPVMVHGLGRVLGSGIAPLIGNFRAVRLAGREVRMAGTGLDMVLDTRALSLADIGDDYGRHSKFERGLRYMSDRFGLVSLMAPWNATLKQWVGMISGTRIMEEAAKWRSGHIHKSNVEYMAMLGIDARMADRIAAMFDAFGETEGGVRLANTEAWTDLGAVKAFRAALVKDVDRIIVTPGVGDRPSWMSTELGQTIGQFKSFSFAATNRVLVSGLQQRDMAVLNGALLSVFLGMGVTAFKGWEAGRELPKDPAVWLAEGVDRSGMLGWFYDANNIIEKVSRGTVGVSPLLGNPPLSRYASRNAMGALLGPSFGTVQTALGVAGSAAAGDWKAQDTRALRRLLPYQNLIGFRQLVDRAEAGINRALGAKK